MAGERKDRDGKDNGLEVLVELKIFKLGFYSECVGTLRCDI